MATVSPKVWIDIALGPHEYGKAVMESMILDDGTLRTTERVPGNTIPLVAPGLYSVTP